jgi:signal transduction histidine kinase
MEPLNILLVDDNVEWAETFSENLLTATPVELFGKEYDGVTIMRAASQRDADHAIAHKEKDGFDLIFLDLDYPENPSGSLAQNDGDYQGMKWLPDLRRLQPNSTIVILTSYASAEYLQHVVKAIRDFDANDFIPKSTPFDLLVARVRVAAENARSMRQLWMLEEEFRALVRTRATRTYAEDVAALLNQTKSSLFRIAQRIEAGDIAGIDAAPEAIRNEYRFLKEEFDKLTELLDEGQEDRRPVDVAALIRQLIRLYEREIERTQAKSVGPDDRQSIALMTYEGDLKLALHEVLNNALDSLARSTQRAPEDRRLECRVEKVDRTVIIRVIDNGDGFSDEAISHMFERGFSTKQDHHRGMGLHIAKRMMNQIGGDIEARNRSEGGAEIEIVVRDLAEP